MAGFARCKAHEMRHVFFSARGHSIYKRITRAKWEADNGNRYYKPVEWPESEEDECDSEEETETHDHNDDDDDTMEMFVPVNFGMHCK
ncbi:hypothetical protein BGX27_002865 [Mortierella sp. AM989]|nr:hypothetical protein BGX27_002865 [Mortierella sp. AM989]